MATEKPIEGNPEGDGADAAKQIASTDQGQPSAADFLALKQQVDTLSTQNRALQSGKDKRWNDVMPVIKRVAERLGIDEAKVIQAQREEVLDDLIAERLLPQGTEANSGKGATDTAQVEVSGIVAEYGLDPADPIVVAFVRDNHFTDNNEAELAVARLLKKKTALPTLTPEQLAVSTSGKTAAASLTDGEKNAKYARLDVLYKTPTKSAAEIKKLETELEM